MNSLENVDNSYFSDHREFHNLHASQFSQLNLHRPPPPLPHDNDMNQQRKSWIHNNPHPGMDSNEANLLEPPPTQNFMSPPPNHRNKIPFQGNFRGQNRGRGNMNNGNSIRGNRGARGNFRGNYRGGGGQW